MQRAIVGLVLVLAGCSAPFRTTVAFTGDQIEQEISTHFPVRKSALIAAVELDHPRILFEDGSDRIGLELDAVATIFAESHTGTAAVLGHLRYDHKTGDFFIDDADLVRLDLPDLDPKDNDTVRLVARAAVAASLPFIPVHRLSPSRQTAKAFIKSVNVKDRTVRVELGI